MKDPVIQVGNPILRGRAKPVPHKDISSKKIRGLIKHMKDILTKEPNGVAIAAPQVGETLRMFVVAQRAFRYSIEEEGEEIKSFNTVFINPEITRASRRHILEHEGCMSVRDVFGRVKRHERVSIKALDEKGKVITYNGSGLLAHIFQHEMDHLDGVLFIDKAVSIDDSEKLKEALADVKDDVLARTKLHL